jgi:mono/diheme cytochrome c family protein
MAVPARSRASGVDRRAVYRSKLCFGILLILTSTASSSLETEPEVTSAESIERGADLFRVYCVDCHGSGGRGDGPSAESLRVRPADLTSLIRSNRGTFPRERARQAIDGRTAVDDHRTTEMPIWGFALQELDQDTEQETEVRRRIDDLLAFLESIQVVSD